MIWVGRGMHMTVLLGAALVLGACSESKTVIRETSKTVTTVKNGTTTTTTQAAGGRKSSTSQDPGGLSYTGASPGFARAVQAEYWRSGGGDITVTAYSEANGRSYDILCTAAARVVCTGGTTRSAYITFPNDASASSTNASGANLSYRGASSGFAQAVRDEWVRRGGGDITVTAYSEANGRSYDIVCTTGRRVVCTGGTTKSAYITFDP